MPEHEQITAGDVLYEAACESESDERCEYRMLAEVALCIDAVNHAAARIDALEALARDMLGRFCQVSDGYRARVGQVQIAKWEKQLGDGDD
jgi:hypothetical protein